MLIILQIYHNFVIILIIITVLSTQTPGVEFVLPLHRWCHRTQTYTMSDNRNIPVKNKKIGKVHVGSKLIKKTQQSQDPFTWYFHEVLQTAIKRYTKQTVDYTFEGFNVNRTPFTFVLGCDWWRVPLDRRTDRQEDIEII